MLRSIVFAGLVTAGLAGAAEPRQPLVNRAEDPAFAFTARNLVGGSIQNPDGSVTSIYQGRHVSQLPTYNEPPAASYQGW